jgi:hypothetical protein
VKIPNIFKIKPRILLKRVAWVISTGEGQANGGIPWILNRFSPCHEKLWVFEILLKLRDW